MDYPWEEDVPYRIWDQKGQLHWISKFVCCLSNLSAIWRLSPLPVTELQILAYAWRPGPLSREGSLSCHTYYVPRFIRSHPKDRHLRPTVGFESRTQGSSDHCTRRSNHCTTQATWYRNRILFLALERYLSDLESPYHTYGLPMGGRCFLSNLGSKSNVKRAGHQSVIWFPEFRILPFPRRFIIPHIWIIHRTKKISIKIL
jgi:hypothetical protein